MEILPPELKYQIAKELHGDEGALLLSRRKKHATSLFPLLGLTTEWRQVALSILFEDIGIADITNTRLEEIIESHTDALRTNHHLLCSLHPMPSGPTPDPMSEEELFGRWDNRIEEPDWAVPEDPSQWVLDVPPLWLAKRVELMVRILNLAAPDDTRRGMRNMSFHFGDFEADLEPLAEPIRKLSLERVLFTNNIPRSSINTIFASMKPRDLSLSFVRNLRPEHDTHLILSQNSQLETLAIITPTSTDYTWLCKDEPPWVCPLTTLLLHGVHNRHVLLYILQQTSSTLQIVRLPETLYGDIDSVPVPPLSLATLIMPLDTSEMYLPMFGHISVTDLRIFDTSLQPLKTLTENPEWFESTEMMMLGLKTDGPPVLEEVEEGLCQRHLRCDISWGPELREGHTWLGLND